MERTEQERAELMRVMAQNALGFCTLCAVDRQAQEALIGEPLTCPACRAQYETRAVDGRPTLFHLGFAAELPVELPSRADAPCGCTCPAACAVHAPA
jgi:hypothetical protein